MRSASKASSKADPALAGQDSLGLFDDYPIVERLLELVGRTAGRGELQA